MANPQIVHLAEPSAASRSLGRDAASIRKMMVKALRQYRRGEMSNLEAQTTSIMAKRALDAMKLEFLTGPALTLVAPPDADDRDDE